MNRTFGAMIFVMGYLLCNGGIEPGSVVYAQEMVKPKPIAVPAVVAQPEITIELLVDKSVTESVYELQYVDTVLPVTEEFLSQCETYLASRAVFAMQSIANQELVSSQDFKKITWNVTDLINLKALQRSFLSLHGSEDEELCGERKKQTTSTILSFFVAIALKEREPNSLGDLSDLLGVANIADVLGHKKVMSYCNYALLTKLIGQQPVKDASVRTLSGHKNKVHSVIYIPGTDNIVSASYDGTLKVWNYKTGVKERTLRGHKNWVMNVVYISGTDFVVSGSYDGTLRVWNFKTKQEERVLRGHISWVQTVIYIPESDYVISGSWDKTINVWNYKTGEIIHTLLGHTRGIQVLLHIPQTDYIISASRDKTLKVWNYKTGKEERSLRGHNSVVLSLIQIPGTDYIVSGSRDNTLIVWNYKTGKKEQVLSGHMGSIKTVMHIPGTDYIASGSNDKTLKIWNYKTGKEVRSFDGHENGDMNVTCVPGTDYIVSGSRDNALKVWNYKTGKEEQSVQGHTAGVESVICIPGTDSIISGSNDDTLKVWNLYPSFDLTFAQINLCYRIFTSKKPIKVTVGSADHTTFLSLPLELQEKILLSKLFIILSV